MTIYQVRLINEAINLDKTINVPHDQYIWDIADEAGIKLPSGCLQGECSVCLAKLISGEIDQNEQNFLNETEIQKGYTVTCVAYPRSNCVLETHQESLLYESSLYLKKE